MLKSNHSTSFIRIISSFTFLLLLCGSVSYIQAQKLHIISGKVINGDQQIITDGTVQILSPTDSSVTETFSWKQGAFRISLSNSLPIVLKFTSLGYTARFVKINEVALAEDNLGMIILKSTLTQLTAVTITSQKSTIQSTSDKITFNVANSGLSIGGTADELLKRTPQVVTASDGTLSIIGKGKALIYLNGMPITADMLKTIPSSNLEKIEVILNPSAKYDASGGGIINLVSKRNKTQASYISADASVTKGKEWRSSYGIQSGISRNRWSVDVKYRYYPSDLQYQDNYVRTIIHPNDTTTFNQNVTKNKYFNNRQAYDIATGLILTSRMTLNVSYSGSIFNGTETDEGVNFGTSTNTAENLQLYNSTHSTIHNTNNILNYEYAINFPKQGNKLVFGGNHTWYNYTKNDNISEKLVTAFNNDTSLKKNDNSNRINLLTLKTDYSGSINKNIQFESGLKYSNSGTASSLTFARLMGNQWVSDNNEFDAYHYNENITSAYLNANVRIQKLNINAGLRAERTHALGKSESTDKVLIDSTYLNLFPSINLSYNLSDDLDVNANYQKRINRPRYQDLNPYRIYIDSLSIFSGNPLLKPEIINSIESSLTYKKIASFKIGFSNTTNSIQTIINSTNSSSLVTTATLKNIDNIKAYYVSLNLPYQIKSWTTYNSITYTKNLVKANLDNTLFDLSKPFWIFYTYHQFLLPKQFQFELTGVYNTSGIDGIFQFRNKLNISSSLKKTINKKLSVGISANDIFNTDIIRTSTHLNDFNLKYRGFEDNASIRLSLSYRLGKSTDKTISKKLDERIKNSNY